MVVKSLLVSVNLLAILGSALTTRGNSPGDVVKVEPSPMSKNLWPVSVAKAYHVTYYTTNALNETVQATGSFFIPPTEQPEDGYRAIAWDHGTDGVADKCAPSVNGAAEPERDNPTLGNYVRAGYAIIAPDYPGLGGPGKHAYLHGLSEAHSTVDLVKAAQRWGASQGKAGTANIFSKKWALVGQSQGAGAAIYTARYATEFGGPELDYRCAVGTGTPAFIELISVLLDPGIPVPGGLSPALSGYLTYILYGIQVAYPNVDWGYTELGNKYINDVGANNCIMDYEAILKKSNFILGDFFSKPIDSIPGAWDKLKEYVGMPTSGYDKPFFLGQGTADTDVPPDDAYYAALAANKQPVTHKKYPGLTHSQTFKQSINDTLAFIDKNW